MNTFFQRMNDDANIQSSADLFIQPGCHSIYGVGGSVKTSFASRAIMAAGKPALIIVPSKEQETAWQTDLQFFAPELPVYTFPLGDRAVFSTTAKSMERTARQMEVLAALCSHAFCAVVATIEESAQPVTAPEHVNAAAFDLSAGQDYERDTLLRRLSEDGYERVDLVERRGHFSVRGDIIDVFAVNYEQPLRLEFFGDTLESLRFFDAASQKSLDKTETVRILPFALDQSGDKEHTVLDYMTDGIIIWDEPNRSRENLKKFLKESADYKDWLCSWRSLASAQRPGTQIVLSLLAQSVPDMMMDTSSSFSAKAMASFQKQFDLLHDELLHWLESGDAVLFVMGSRQRIATLKSWFAQHGFSVMPYNDTVPLESKQIYLAEGEIRNGFELPYAKLVVISERDIYGMQKHRLRHHVQKGQEINVFTDLKAGDYVVHEVHGIGRYAGIQRMAVQGVTKDYLRIEYDKKDVLYVPVTQLDLLSRYTAPNDSDNVKLSRLGGSDWAKTRKKVKAATEQMAKELIELYARRKQAKGHAFPPDDTWQGDFEQRFAYDETPDQLTCAADIKHDMEEPWPMDRLLCGDVGFGKTEVALRAAFKCVMGGKQCAILAPTTILAWQHFNTAIARMEAFPVRIGLLSRYRSAKEQKETLRGLKDGTVDIVIGTHRLLSNDVKFHDLGLVIIDEEQRFGVKHKEKLKEAFIGVDMLTLSATPIPRTLNMALSGIRDMSTLEQPPFERQPVETYVLEYDEGIVAEAIRKELARGGQVYYLHNRVDTIEECAARVGKMVPGARIGIAHGKMTEEQISSVWQQLLDNEIDILVCTTLIETGVDVRNCNTLIIENADRMGLSQLYQIRGRVGRSSRKAYAYFTFTRDKVLTEVAAKRLSAIREFTSFGSGFRIAMRDLQIRGAGSLLGHSQHGHMESVGYDLYVKMLSQAISAARGETPAPDKSDCLIDITVDAFLPEDYIPDAAGRIEAYKRIAAIETTADADDVIDELIDRYGSPPKSVQGLVDVSLIRVTAARVGIAEIVQRGDQLILYSDIVGPKQLAPLMDQYPHRVLYNALGRPYFSLRVQKGENPLVLLRDIVTLLPGAQGEKEK